MNNPVDKKKIGSNMVATEKMCWTKTEEGILLKGIKDFSVEQTLSCGQCFRWVKEEDGSFTGIAYGQGVNVKELEAGSVLFRDCSLEAFENIWWNYFDFGRDYTEIKRVLIHEDEIMEKAIAFGGGIHILNQEPWEMLVSYIISSNNSISNITRCISRLSERYGSPLIFREKTMYGFPTIDQLAGESEEALMECRVGYRCKYISAVVKLAKQGSLDIESLRALDYQSAKKELMKLPGIGPKVADCIALFSLGKYEAYPNDVWIKRVTETLYLHKASNPKEIEAFARSKFGAYAGFAQEYLFFYSRLNGFE